MCCGCGIRKIGVGPIFPVLVRRSGENGPVRGVRQSYPDPICPTLPDIPDESADSVAIVIRSDVQRRNLWKEDEMIILSFPPQSHLNPR
jgi:hypothetical protein